MRDELINVAYFRDGKHDALRDAQDLIINMACRIEFSGKPHVSQKICRIHNAISELIECLKNEDIEDTEYGGTR